MRSRHWIMVGTAFLLASCNTAKPKAQPSPQAFAQPIVAAQPTVPPKINLPTIAVPGMIQTSNGKLPLMPVAVDRDRDPFAATLIPTSLKAALQPAPPRSIAVKSTVASQPVAALPPAIPQPIVRYIPTQPLPSLPMMSPPMPPVVPTNLADAIALTGVIQTGSKLSAIVQDADGSSRHVQAGESLANGEVTVKKINLNPVGNPSIVLQQNGVELIKIVGKFN